jgi:ABC-type metal ion transport system substrate-binding protein
MNLEKYSKTYENVREFKNMLNTIFSIWESNSAKVLGIIIREDLITLVDEKYILTETHDIIMGESHFAKNKKRFRERLYIFKKSAESNV